MGSQYSLLGRYFYDYITNHYSQIVRPTGWNSADFPNVTTTVSNSIMMTSFQATPASGIISPTSNNESATNLNQENPTNPSGLGKGRSPSLIKSVARRDEYKCKFSGKTSIYYKTRHNTARYLFADDHPTTLKVQMAHIIPFSFLGFGGVSSYFPSISGFYYQILIYTNVNRKNPKTANRNKMMMTTMRNKTIPIDGNSPRNSIRNS